MITATLERRGRPHLKAVPGAAIGVLAILASAARVYSGSRTAQR